MTVDDISINFAVDMNDDVDDCDYTLIPGKSIFNQSISETNED